MDDEKHCKVLWRGIFAVSELLNGSFAIFPLIYLYLARDLNLQRNRESVDCACIEKQKWMKSTTSSFLVRELE